MSKPFKLIPIVLSLLLTSVYISCDEDDDCDETICTLEFRTFSVLITDENQNPIVLDAFEVINSDNGQNITVSLTPTELENAVQQGRYPLVDDNSFGTNEEVELRFSGFMNGQEVISSMYTVSTDCCHISVVSGDLELII
ncbi:hypothetical protein [Aquimarina litoralis]|uniref:hypothetical protein n=1 Tax=Aquimarina litoralis TaxID=584605 RepID=UPI001C589E3F|nr:hypothetical protein [Aquimarina litoralis]MBW1295950.1 hypothetical protein [Aquimarina litoralis]